MTRSKLILLLFAAAAVLAGCSTLDVPVAETKQPHRTVQPKKVQHQKQGSIDRDAEPIHEEQPTEPLPQIKLVADPDAAKFVAAYLKGGRRTVEDALRRRRQHISVVAEEFIRIGVPVELSNIAIIESGFNPNSRGKGTAGLWQFTRQTAVDYGLKVDKQVDQRMDVRRSSAAAAKHLADLYRVYEDWYLVLAAYNCGRYRVDRGIKQTGQRDYFKLKQKRGLSKTTSEFVPRFLALTEILRHPDKYGFEM